MVQDLGVCPSGCGVFGGRFTQKYTLKLSGSTLSGVATAKFANIFGGAVLQNNYKYELQRVNDNPIEAMAAVSGMLVTACMGAGRATHA
jgi:hypothetical protein